MEKKVHILFVDDDEVVRRLFGAKLAATGFEVTYAKDGNEGREMARRFQPDLILLDLDMPIMDGTKTISLLKDEQQTAHIPIVLFTNSDLSIETEKLMKEMGVTEYISKAVDSDKFIDMINKALANYTSSDKGKI